ncbi:MAG: hypothetical protein ABEK01_04690 [Candidatus Nanohaloarchaea archaeon]
MGVYFLTIGLPFLSPYSFGGEASLLIYYYGVLFMFVAAAHYIQVPLHILKPGWKKYGFYGTVGAGVLAVAWNMAAFSPVEGTGIEAISTAGLPSSPLITLLTLGVFALGGGGFFIYLSMKRHGVERGRLLLVALGFIGFTVFGAVQQAYSPELFSESAWGITISLISIFAGVMLKSRT